MIVRRRSLLARLTTSQAFRLVSRRNRHGVDLKTLDRRSLSRPHLHQQMRPARTPPSTFLFLPIQLSNSPDRGAKPKSNPPSGEPSSIHPATKKCNRQRSAAFHCIVSEELTGTASCRGSGAPSGRLICPGQPACQRPRQENVAFRRNSFDGRGSRCKAGGIAPLRPHSSSLVCR